MTRECDVAYSLCCLTTVIDVYWNSTDKKTNPYRCFLEGGVSNQNYTYEEVKAFNSRMFDAVVFQSTTKNIKIKMHIIIIFLVLSGHEIHGI